jgi:hypothetical protein
MAAEKVIRPPRGREDRLNMDWRRLTGVAVCCLAMLAALLSLLTVWLQVQQVPAASVGAVLILRDSTQPAGQYRLLRLALANAGFALATVLLPARPAATPTDLQADSQAIVQEALQQLAVQTGCSPDQVWLAASGETSGIAFQIAENVPQLAGVLLIAPVNLDSIKVEQRQNWPSGRSLALLLGRDLSGGLTAAGAATPDAIATERARRLFESVSGEDAHLLPAYRENGFNRPLQYTSSDGGTYLAIYPDTWNVLALYSPVLLPDAARLLGEWSGQPATAAQLAAQGRRTVSQIFLLLLAGIFLLAVPFALGLARRVAKPLPDPIARKPELQTATANIGHSPDASVAWWLETLLWLPALLLAGALGWLLAQALAALLPNAQHVRWLFLAVIILPGCRGWLFGLVRLLRSRWLQGDSRAGGEPRAVIQLRRVIASAIAALLFLLLVTWWLASYFGTLLPNNWPWLVLPLLAVVNYPAGLAGAAGRLGAVYFEGLSERSDPIASLWQHLPFLILPVAAVILNGWSGLLAGLLVLVISIVSASLGKSITGLSRLAGLGSLAQAVLFSLAVLVPPIAAGL